MEKEKPNNLQERLLHFVVDAIQTLRLLERSVENNAIKFQLIKSASSMGANYEESQAASSRKDFNNKVKIALKEARETNYWLKILVAINENPTVQPKLLHLLDESSQLKKILGSIASKSADVSKK
jgi:four helix bundle protein